jgi:alpha-glucoside transport system permease protein
MSDVVPNPVPVAKKIKGEKLGTSVAASFHSRPGRILVWMLALLWTVPTFGVFVSSFRPELDVKTTGWWTFFLHPKRFTLSNYKSVLSTESGNEGLSTFLGNSFKITIPSVIISVSVAALAAYGFSWINFKGRDWMYSFIMGLLIVPLQMCLIPISRFFTGGAHLTIGGVTIPLLPYLHFDNTVVAVWIAHSIFGLPFCIFLMKNFIGGLPREIIEAARVDGASHLTTFTKLVLPLSVPAIASVAIFQFVYIWNDYLVGLVYGGSENKPIIAAMADLTGSRGQSWHLLTAAGFVSMIVPVTVFLALQRFFVKGLLAGSVKG